jgi:primosomal protein N' (replication factor Y)
VLFQREPLPSVALAGIVQADSGMSIPDFRAAERTYQLLGDAIDLVRPAASGGRVILQTLLPAHHVIESLMTGNPSRFYEEELAARRLLGYPPALHLVVVSVSGKDPSTVERTARQLVEHLEKSASGDTATGSKPLPNRAVHASTASPDTLHERLTVLGPVRTAGGTRHGHQRRQIMVKGRDRACLHEAVRAAVKAVEETVLSKRVKVVVDVDPVEMG